MKYNTKGGIDAAEMAKARLVGLLTTKEPFVPQNAVDLIIDEIVQAAVAEVRNFVGEVINSHVCDYHSKEV